ncbi:MAG: NAD-dependent epimerase/dehydratase family protein [Streptosporangiaceae bacterium]
MTKRICVTGASGRAGRVTVRELLAHGYRVVATDRVMPAEDRPSAELLAEVYPGVTLTREVGEFGTLLAIDQARAALGFTPQHSWRDHVDPRSSRP